MEEMTLGQWIGTLVLCMIPCVNIVMLIIWAVSSGNETRKKFAQAYLIVMVAMMVIYGILYVLLGASMLATAGLAGSMLIGA